MGQKVNPIGMRVGINRTWDSRWFSDKNYAEKLVQDLKLREFVKDRLKMAGISKVIIERAAQNTTVTVYTARPGVIIGKKGADIEKLRRKLSEKAGNDVSLNIVEIRKPEMDAQLVAEGVCQQLERRVSFRRAMKRAVQSCLRMGAEGIRVSSLSDVGPAIRQATQNQKDGKTTVVEMMVTKELGDPFRRDAMKLPQRVLAKYSEFSEESESATGQPTDFQGTNSQH